MTNYHKFFIWKKYLPIYNSWKPATVDLLRDLCMFVHASSQTTTLRKKSKPHQFLQDKILSKSRLCEFLKNSCRLVESVKAWWEWDCIIC